MDFNLSDDQLAIKDLAAQIFKDQVTDEYLLARDENVAYKTYDSDLWKLLAEQGLLGLSIPEHCGGSGLGFIELCTILEEQGRRLAPLPLLSSLVMGAMPISKFGTLDQQQQLLAPLATGEHRLSAAIAELGMVAHSIESAVATQQGDVWRISGVKHAVPFACDAAFILVPATDDSGRTSVFIVDTKSSGVSTTAQELDLGWIQSELVLDNVVADGLLGEIGQGEEILEYIEQRVNTAQGAIQVGVCDEALKRTAAYTGERKQFGAPIGSFQAVAMRAADGFMDIEALRSTFWAAAWRLSEGLDAEPEVRAAKYWTCEAGHRVSHTCQHLHGGMGATREFPIHRYFLWAKYMEFMFGNATTQLVKLGQYLAANDDSGVRWMEL
jgi:alkylation response protein AidB-like acyl-CoA dehydrogenase